MKKLTFVIDTDSYAGNFEREMCAYLTGVVGDCDVGKEFAGLYSKDTGEEEYRFLEYLGRRYDDHGCARPCSIYPTAGWVSVGHDHAVLEKDWDQSIADKAWQKAQVAIYQGYYDMYASYDLSDEAVIRAGWTEKSMKKQLERCQSEIDAARVAKSPKSKPMNSVAIFFNKCPTDDMIASMKLRAGNFAEAKRSLGREMKFWDKNFNLKIHGFRLVEETTKKITRPV